MNPSSAQDSTRRPRPNAPTRPSDTPRPLDALPGTR